MNLSRLNTLCLLILMILFFYSCQEKIGEEQNSLENAGVLEFYNPAAERTISQYGEVLGCTIKTLSSYTMELVSESDEEWARFEKGQNGHPGFNQIRLSFSKNELDQVRRAEMYITVEGYQRTRIAVFEQDMVVSEQERNEKLNKYMHERLLKEYLWSDAYADIVVDLTMDYKDFLSHHLLQLGDRNIEDGGYVKGHSDNVGDRFIYSNIQPVNPNTKSLTQISGLGFGPFFASMLSSDGSVYCLAVSYVHPGSPADLAGIRRGDAIYIVNGEYVTSDNYSEFNTELSQKPSGTYDVTFFRNGNVGDGKEIQASFTAGQYSYNPVLLCDVIDGHTGYLVLENFDFASQSALVDAVNTLKSADITDLILDLRYNQGGSVAQSRWLTSCVAGASNLDNLFSALVYNDGTRELWQFRGGPDDYDGLGIGPDLGLDRVYVIGSYYTASAAEMVVNSLRGIGFDVYLIGGKTEGKNVGMTSTYVTVDGVKYVFSPITFRIENAMGFGNYSDGLTPDYLLSDQDLDFSDGDIDMMFPHSFGDWTAEGANIALEAALALISQ